MPRLGPSAAIVSAHVLCACASAQEASRGPAPDSMRRATPELARYTDDVLFGEVWERPGLAKRDRSIVTVTALIATGRTGPLRGHMGRALTNGVTVSELSGIVTHLGFYSGWPSAVGAVSVLDELLAERGLSPRPAGSAALLPAPANDGERAARVMRDVGPTAPELARLTNEVLFNDLWLQPDLSPRDRSLVTIAALGASGDTGQLPFHVGRGLENGLTREEVAEAATHLAFYAGWPKAMNVTAALANSPVAAAPAPAQAAPPVVHVAPGVDPQAGPANRFIGSVSVTSRISGSGGSRLGGATVTFQPGARTNWHSHPMGQLLIVIEGEGRVQDEGGAVRILRPGDKVWTAPGVKHWHGAAPDQAMSHAAVSESVEGASVVWMEPVTDDVYRRAPEPRQP
jgi:4-carboxymuconolactone decarboxylase